MKGAAPRLENALQANGVEHDVKEYADAGHSFLEVHGGALGWVMALIGMRHHEPSAADARQRILWFFGHHLRQTERDDASLHAASSSTSIS